MCPVRDERWILETFLEHHSHIFDAIIIADQQSTDGSREIASNFSSCIVVDNLSTSFDEPHMRQLMLDKARELFGLGHLLFALDADELLIIEEGFEGNLSGLLECSLGTRFSIERRNLLPDLNRYWAVAGGTVAFIDDGSDFPVDGFIHAPRIPTDSRRPTIQIDWAFELHLQFILWERMESKHRWYRRLELTELRKDLVAVYRRYSHMYSIPAFAKKVVALPSGVINRLQETRDSSDGVFRWDLDSMKMDSLLQSNVLRLLNALETSRADELVGRGEKLLFWYLVSTTKWSNSTFFPIVARMIWFTDLFIRRPQRR
jgi:hypothetical protein